MNKRLGFAYVLERTSWHLSVEAENTVPS